MRSNVTVYKKLRTTTAMATALNTVCKLSLAFLPFDLHGSSFPTPERRRLTDGLGHRFSSNKK